MKVVQETLNNSLHYHSRYGAREQGVNHEFHIQFVIELPHVQPVYNRKHINRKQQAEVTVSVPDLTTMTTACANIAALTSSLLRTHRYII